MKKIFFKDETNKKIWDLAFPATIETALQFLIGFIDIMMITRISLIAVTAISVANSVMNVYLSVFIALGIGATALISKKSKSEDKDNTSGIAAQATVLAIIVGIVLGAVAIIFGSNIMQLVSSYDDVSQLSAQFFGIVGGGAVVISLMMIFGSILRANGDAKSPMKISIVVNAVNIVASFVLIFGIGFVPALGVVGSAIATVFSRFVGCVLLYRKIRKSSVAFNFSVMLRQRNFADLIRLSIPATLERLIMRLGQVIYFSIIVAIGAITLASHAIIGSIEMFVSMAAYGLSIALATLVGQSVGAKTCSDIERLTYRSIRYGVIILGFFGIILFFSVPAVALIFTDDQEAIDRIIIGSRIFTFSIPALATSTILTGALQGMGDTKTPMYSTAVGMWGVRMLGVIVFGFLLDLDIAGVWLSIGIDLYVRSVFLFYRFKRNVFKLRKNELPSLPGQDDRLFEHKHFHSHVGGNQDHEHIFSVKWHSHPHIHDDSEHSH